MLRRKSRTVRKPLFRPNLVQLEGREVPATLTVNTATDGIDHADSLLTLREAVEALNAASTAGFSAGEKAQINTSPFGFGKLDAIRFDAALAGSTVTLTGGQLNVTKAVSISGLTGSSGITISGNNASRHFNFTDSTVASLTVSINNLTLTNGFAGGGGSFLNQELETSGGES